MTHLYDIIKDLDWFCEYSNDRQDIRGKWIKDYNASLPQRIEDTEFGEMSFAIGGIYDGEWELYHFDNVMSQRIKRLLKKEGKTKNWELMKLINERTN
jgi:hypothetical protein|tara:strand:+ start:483 stop:776 length:294 start_codon:yes stop_codon:yes gene_type:complete